MLVCSLMLPMAEPAITVADLRLDQIQVIGTHNSYHLRPLKTVFDLAVTVQPNAKEWDYSRQPLDRQLDHGIRNFELDLHLAGDEWHVMHVPVLDPKSTVRDFPTALAVVKEWSDRHPRHVPFFLMELKEEGTVIHRGIKVPQKGDLDRLDSIIFEVFPRDRVITPDDVRGKHATLSEAVGAGGWPNLAKAAGKVLFILHERGKNQELYLQDHPALAGRAMFVNALPGQPHSGVIVLDSPQDPEIKTLAKKGYFIRTRVDGQRHVNESVRQQGLNSGAQILSTDYPLGEFEEKKAFTFPGHAVARPNPVTAPAELKSASITEPLANGVSR